ncbi:hypothetical protein MUB15_14545 [Priestia sp. OVS21]|nr:hypothetical protein [Priestia sp. OVS21]
MKKEHKKEESQVKVDFRAGRAYGDHEYIGSSKKGVLLALLPVLIHCRRYTVSDGKMTKAALQRLFFIEVLSFAFFGIGTTF